MRTTYARKFENFSLPARTLFVEESTVVIISRRIRPGSGDFFGLWETRLSLQQLDMSLDATACLKALSSAFCQYRSHASEQNTKDLERQIDVCATLI